jgi:hypothetical protein
MHAMLDPQSSILEISPEPQYDHPLADPDFSQEKEGSRAHILKWWDIVTEVDAAPRSKRGLTIASVAFVNGLPARTVKNIHSAWRTGNAHRTRYPSRDWRALANRSKYPDPQESNPPAAFIAWVKSIYEKHQRDTTFKRSYECVMAALTLWERDPFNPDAIIPGYDSPPLRNPFRGYPAGWSLSNLQRRCRSTEYEKAARRQGPKTASKFLPSVRTTRGPGADGRSLEFGELMYFDDQDHDTLINLTGVNAKAMRPQSFDALEALSGNLFETGLKPQLWDEAADKRRELDATDFFWFVMTVLTKHGYNAQAGTTLIWEHGKANPDKTGKFDEDLAKITGGAVRVDKSGIWRAPEFKAMLFEGKPTGNFRFKAPIESFFNLLRNYSAALPAPTGRNRDLAPEENHGLVAENDRMLKLIDKLPIDTFMRLKREVLEWEDYCQFHRLILRAINARRDHALEGWQKLGFTGARYRLGDDKPWMDELDYQAIPAEERALYRHIVTKQGNNEMFRLSPEEVFMMRRSQLTKLPMRLVPVLAPARAWEPVTVTQSLEIAISDKWLDSEPLIFIAKITTPQGYEAHLKRGETYKRLLNIFDPTKLWIADRKGAYLGVAHRVQAACKLDQHAILRQLGEIKHVKAAESVEMHARMQTEATKRVAARKFNRDLLAGKPVSMAERMKAIAMRKMDGGGIAELAEPAAPPAGDFDAPVDAEFSAEGLL